MDTKWHLFAAALDDSHIYVLNQVQKCLSQWEKMSHTQHFPSLVETLLSLAPDLDKAMDEILSRVVLANNEVLQIVLQQL